MSNSEPTVLVVDDEPEVGRFIALTLSCNGFRPLLAFGGRDAAAQYQARHREIDLVLTDVVMADLAGPALANLLRTIRNDVRILYMSGYKIDHIERYKEELSNAQMLSKPFTPPELLDAVRSALKAGH
jgi:two-component system cell cycle sensor histidine kinase/response regulator CckA